MNICPAILTNNIDFFREKLRMFQIFEIIEIDLIIPGNLVKTIPTIQTEEIIEEITRYPSKKFHIHLMCDEPFIEIAKFKNVIKIIDIIFIIHQESNFGIEEVKSFDFPIGLGIKLDTKLLDLAYYNQFSMIQLMCIEIGKQGNKFQPNVLEKVKKLRNLGYDREVSLDGGINLETAHLIISSEVNSVAAGSYFSKSLDIPTDKRKLEHVLKLNIT